LFLNNKLGPRAPSHGARSGSEPLLDPDSLDRSGSISPRKSSGVGMPMTQPSSVGPKPST